VKYRFINDHRHEHGVATMYRVLGANKAGFYAWLHKPLSDRAIEDQWLLTLIRASHAGSGRVYGSRRVFADLRKVEEAGERCGKNRVTRIMHDHKIKA
jgi:putative transposase